MTTAELRAVAGPLVFEESPNEGCDYMHVEHDMGISFMIFDGRVARIDIDDAHHATLSGVRIGDRESRVKSVYAGRFVESPHTYIEEGHYFTVKSRDSRYALVIETNGERVTYMRSGKRPEAEWVERCL
jgi:hypothetical protein